MKQSNQIEAGDVVTLKSGGPIMTVTEVGRIYDDGALHAWVTWFDEAKNLKDSFPLAALKKQD